MKFTFPSGARPLEGFTIKRGIGQGGFGEVYYAVSDAGKDVALKLIRRNLEVELRGVRQCLNLKHPNLLGLFDIRVDEQGDSWVVMEYIAGQCLEDVLNQYQDGLPIDDALRWFHGIGAAVDYLHDHGIVHRDLKPGNIFCDEGVVKIGDYGLSKFISVSRRSGQTESVGTVHYMAPEIANGRYGKEIDVYALGVLLYELITGHVPFEGESVGEVLMKHLTAEPDLSRLSEPYRSVCRRALLKDATQRYSSVREMLAALPAPKEAPILAQLASPMGGKPTAPPRQPQNDPMAHTAPHALEHVRRAWHEADRGEPVSGTVHGWFNAIADAPAATKAVVVALIVGVVFAAAALRVPVAGVWPGVLVTAVLAYLAYSVARANPQRAGQHHGDSPHSAATAESVAEALPPRRDPPQAHHARYPMVARHRSWKQQVAEQLQARPMRPRATELIGSMLLSALVVSVVTVLFVTLFNAPMAPEQVTWVALVSMLGSWIVLATAKSWEGRQGDTARRRFVLLIAGLALGSIAWALHAALFVALPYDHSARSYLEWLTPPGAVDVAGQPTLVACLAYFGLVFLVPRWWLQADPLRASRVSIWTTVLCGGVAYFVSLFWAFPQPWGVMAVVSISLAVQLSSPWIRPQRSNSAAA